MNLQATVQRIKKVVEKKPLLDFFIALLTIPFLLLLIFINVSSLTQKNKTNNTQQTVSTTPNPNSNQTPAPVIIRETITTPATDSAQTTATPTPQQCNQTPQPYSILFPSPGQIVSDINPVCVAFQPIGSGYCSTQISYSINNGSWSGYQPSDHAICMQNLSDGPVHFQMKTRSDQGGLEQQYTVDFTYKKTSNTPTPATGSAN